MTEYLIYVKHRKEWESIRRSWAAAVLYWVSGCSIRGWDPYNRHDYCLKEGGIKPEDPIWLCIDKDRTITFTRKPPCWPAPDPIRWKDYCIERRKQNDLQSKHHHHKQV